MTEFLLVRHGEPDYERIRKWSNVDVARNYAPLTEVGVKQIENTIKELKKENADIIISSPFTRSLQGAGMMARELQLEFFVEPDLHEWELDKTHLVRTNREFKHLLRQRDLGKWNKKSKWESREEVCDRVFPVFERYLQYDKVIVSCHAVLMQMITGDTEPYEYGEVRRFVYEKEKTAKS